MLNRWVIPQTLKGTRVARIIFRATMATTAHELQSLQLVNLRSRKDITRAITITPSQTIPISRSGMYADLPKVCVLWGMV